jgi:hypothetical protein
LQANLSYPYSETFDDAIAEVFGTTLTPRRSQNSENINANCSRSALDRTASPAKRSTVFERDLPEPVFFAPHFDRLLSSIPTKSSVFIA